ncbi:hypothetical protein OQA88_13466 [Cercophora sp. LCS_1]
MSFMVGHHNQHLAADPHSHHGVWSPPDSRANFCEEDYAITYYITEFINSLTNIAYVVPALQFMYGPGSRGILSPNLDFMSVALSGLGIGSFLFHASLRYTLEFVDELSMLILTWSMLQACLTIRQTPGTARLISVALTVFYIPFCTYYVYSPKIVYQVAGFSSGLVLVGLRTHYLFQWAKPSFSREEVRAWRMRGLKAIVVCLVGYLFWNIDIKYCAELRTFKAQVGLPLAWLLEFHGWWHVLTALGASQFMQVLREMGAVEREKRQ